MKSRTPRNYSGTQNPAKKIADMLPSVLQELGRKGLVTKEEVADLWSQLLGEKWAKMTEIVSFKDQVLTVKVKSSTLYSLLVAHERPRLLAGLNKKFSIRNLIFRVG